MFQGAALPLTSALRVLVRERVTSDEQLINFGVSEAWESLRHETMTQSHAVLGCFIDSLVEPLGGGHGKTTGDNNGTTVFKVVSFLSAKLLLDAVVESKAPETSLAAGHPGPPPAGSHSGDGSAVGVRWMEALLIAAQQWLNRSNTNMASNATKKDKETQRLKQFVLIKLLRGTFEQLQQFRIRSSNVALGSEDVVSLSTVAEAVPNLFSFTIAEICPLLALLRDSEDKNYKKDEDCRSAADEKLVSVRGGGSMHEKKVTLAQRPSACSALAQETNQTILVVFETTAAAILSFEKNKTAPTTSNNNKISEMRSLDPSVEAALWKHCDVWQRAIKAVGEWHCTQAALDEMWEQRVAMQASTLMQQRKMEQNGQEQQRKAQPPSYANAKITEQLLSFSVNTLSSFVDSDLKKDRHDAELVAQKAASPDMHPSVGDTVTIQNALWGTTLKLCEVVQRISNAIVRNSTPAIAGLALQPPSTNKEDTQRRMKDLVHRCLRLVNSGLAGASTSSLTTIVALSCAGILIGGAVSNRRAMHLWKVDPDATSSLHDLLVTKGLLSRPASSSVVSSLAARLSSHILTAQLSAASHAAHLRLQRNSAPHQVENNKFLADPHSASVTTLPTGTSKLLDLLTSRDAVSLYVCQVVADAAMVNPHLVIPSLFTLVKQAAANNGNDLAAQSRRNALDVLALLPLKCLEDDEQSPGSVEPSKHALAAGTSAVIATVRQRLTQELLQVIERSDDEELFDRVQTAKFFRLADPQDVMRPLLVAIVRRDPDGKRRSTASAALKACVAGHANDTSVLTAMVTVWAEVKAGHKHDTSPTAAHPPASPSKGFVPKTPRDLIAMSQSTAAASSLLTEEDESRKTTADSVVGARGLRTITDVIVRTSSTWATAAMTATAMLSTTTLTERAKKVFELYIQKNPSTSADEDDSEKELLTAMMGAMVPVLAKALGRKEFMDTVLAPYFFTTNDGGVEGKGALTVPWFVAVGETAHGAPSLVLQALSPLLMLRVAVPTLIEQVEEDTLTAQLTRLLFPSTASTLRPQYHQWHTALQKAPFPPEVFRLLAECASRLASTKVIKAITAIVEDSEDKPTDLRLALFCYCNLLTNNANNAMLTTLGSTVVEKAIETSLGFRASMMGGAVPAPPPSEDSMKLERGCMDTVALSIVSELAQQSPAKPNSQLTPVVEVAESVSKQLTPCRDKLLDTIETCTSAFRAPSTNHHHTASGALRAKFACDIAHHAAVVGASHRQHSVTVLRNLQEGFVLPLIGLANALTASTNEQNSTPQAQLALKCAVGVGSTIFNLVAMGNKVVSSSALPPITSGGPASTSPTSTVLASSAISTSLMEFSIGCCRYDKCPPLQLEGVKLMAAVMAAKPDVFVVSEAENLMQRAFSCLERLSMMSAEPQARELAEKVLLLLSEQLEHS